MLTKKQQAISGVSPGFETVVEDVYPSIAATSIGESLNQLYESIPIRIWGVKLSHIFALMTAPLGALIYLGMKVVGSRYLLTNKSIKRMSGLGFRQYEEVALTNIASVSVDPDSRQAFYKTGDIRLCNAAGDTLLLMRGIPRPDRFVQVIEEMRTAKSQVAQSLARIQARQ